MSVVIRSEHLSKKYILRHQARESYTALRDVISRKVKDAGKKLMNGTSNSYPDKEEFFALHDVSFDIEQGDRVGIIGRNGAGKSTLLKILSRITEPSAGKVSIKGRIASLLEVGTGFHPELTGRENIFLNGSILGMSKTEIRKKFDEIVAFAEVERFLDTPVKRYSSGMYVRLAFAVAAHLDPEILLVDEVLAVGDALFQKKCLGKMEEVSRDGGRTVIFVSHNMQAVQKLCKKGMLLRQGQLISFGEIDSVINTYLESSDAGQATFQIPLPVDYNKLAGYVERVQIENRSGTPVMEVPVGGKWQIRVKFHLNSKTENFVIALGLVTALELPLQTSWSESKTYDAGDYEVIFRNDDIMLTSGQYKLVVGMSSYQRTIHYVDDAGRLLISDAGNIAADNRLVNTKSGLLLNPMEISIHQL